MSYAPQAIWQLFDDIQKRIPASEMGGIQGDANHSFGYHLSRNELPSSDYSVVLPNDQLGSPDAASALDVTYGNGSPWMVTVTQRLLDAARAHDPRLHALREFCGTTDGQNTHPYDLSNDQDGPLNSWDNSHLFHVHLSFYREYADDYSALAPIADVIAGGVAPDSQNQTPLTEEDELANYPYIIVNKANPAEAAVVEPDGTVTHFSNGSDVGAFRAAFKGQPQFTVSAEYFARRTKGMR